MDTEELESLQKSLLTIISSLIVEDNEEEISRMQNQALEIISNKDYREHINDDTPYRCTILDAVKKCSVSVGQSYIEKRGLAEIEQAIKYAGGKTSEELGRNSSLNEVHDEALIEAFADVLIEVQLRKQRVAKISIVVGSMVGAFLGGMLCSRFSTTFKEGSFTWTESLINGLMGAVCAGASSFLAERIIPTNRRDVLANLENAAIEQLNIQQR